MDKPRVEVEHPQHPYAHARETGPSSPEAALEIVFASPGEFKRLNSRLRHLSNKQRWRALTQRRCALLAITLRACERAIGSSYAGRERDMDRRWVLFAHDDQGGRVAVIMIGPSQPKRFEDFDVPLELALLAPARFNLEVFEAWRRDDRAQRQRRRASMKSPTRRAG